MGLVLDINTKQRFPCQLSRDGCSLMDPYWTVVAKPPDGDLYSYELADITVQSACNTTMMWTTLQANCCRLEVPYTRCHRGFHS